MAAPQIPNLSTFRRGRGAMRGRGQGLGSSVDHSQSAEASTLVKDEIVQQTDQDASVSRLSAGELG